jgi:tRNA A37 threonylcarbamoyladenosine synthetase subunit TsaC/SUA5/YrdC
MSPCAKKKLTQLINQPQYTGRDGIDFEPTIDVHVRNFIHLIRAKYLSTATESNIMDLAEKAQSFLNNGLTQEETLSKVFS